MRFLFPRFPVGAYGSVPEGPGWVGPFRGVLPFGPSDLLFCGPGWPAIDAETIL